MIYGDNWKKEPIREELKEILGDRIEGYYKWKLKTNGAECAHVFFSTMESQKDLKADWKKVVDSIAVYVQSEIPGILERSNFYVWFFVTEKVETDLVKEIEDNTYSSRKFVVSAANVMTVEEKLDMVRKKLFSFNFVIPESDCPVVTGVELMNFRIYRGKREFSFIRDGRPARLVVLFAPNGMGKTSFFDGIEWGLTGSVGRFTGIADKNILGSTVLKNTEAKPEESAYVKIYQDENNWIERKVSEISGRTQKDYGTGRPKSSESNPLKEYLSANQSSIWNSLILPHHKIDGFIAGMKPKELYKEWGDLWDTDGEKRRQFEESYNRKRKEFEKYDQLTKMCGELKEQYEKLETSRSFVESLERDVEDFLKISGNTVIGKLAFSTISASEYVQWSSLVDSQYDLYEKNREKIERNCNYLDREAENDIKTYGALCAKEKEITQEQRKVKSYLSKCHNKKILLGQKEELEKKREELGNEIEEVQFLYEKGETWYQDVMKYFGADVRLEELKIISSNLDERFSALQAEGDRFMIELEKKKRQRREENEYRRVCEHAKELEELKKKQEVFVVQKADCERQISGIQSVISEKEKKLEKLEKNRIKDFKCAKTRYEKSTIEPEEDTGLQLFSDFIFQKMKEYQKLEENLKQVVQKILAEEQTEDCIRKILSDARQVIEDGELSYCPICNTKFSDYRELLEHTYKVNSEESEKRKEKKQEIEIKMTDLQSLVEDNIENYNSILTRLTGTIKEEIERFSKECSEKEEKKEEIEKNIVVLKKRMAEIQRQDQENGIYVVYQKEGIENWRDMWNTKLDQEITGLKSDIQKNSEQKTACQEQIANCRNNLDEIKELVSRMEAQSLELYFMMKKKEQFIMSQPYVTLEEWIVNQKTVYEELNRKFAVCSEQLDELQDISLFQETDFEKQYLQIQRQIESTGKELLSVRNRLSDMLKMEISNEAEIPVANLEDVVKEKRKILLKEKEHIEACTECLRKLKYNREAENYFLQWKEVSESLKKAEKEAATGKKWVEETEEKYQQQKQKIEQEMEEFLQRYQMGEIYEKLEPHEKLKHLVARFSFDEKEQPGLSFAVIGEEGKPYPPAWFLSTAQLNVAAFAIFLGKALQKGNAPLKSIFIDDPIGHFDEMNIVGFVDLLRNILENTDRQLIISTHEERVFRLIRRKMPEESYPVCYIDFREMQA